jgi:N-methylhydantoinase B
LIREDGGVDMLPSKVPHMRIRAGERFVCVGPAGGGYGDPLARDPARVREDVADGFVSVEAAKHDYGVALTATGIVDEAASSVCAAR